MAEPTTERIDALLQDLDQIARDHDHYEYGLPLHVMDDETGAPLSKLRDAVRAWDAAGVGETSVEAQQARNKGVER